MTDTHQELTSIDASISKLSESMLQACEKDNKAIEASQPAVAKLRLLPSVSQALNRKRDQDKILDPESSFMQSVKFFLEPLNDGSLPGYDIQREIFEALEKLPMSKDLLISSGIGKVVLFYTRTKRAQPYIKRIAERLVGEWTRP